MRFEKGTDYLDYVSERIDQLEVKIGELIVRLNEERQGIFLSGNADGDRVQTSTSADKIINALSRLEELEERIDILVDFEYKTKKNAMRWILKVESNESKEILIDKYINNLTNAKIAMIEEVDVRTIQRRHKKALEEFCEIFKPF